MNSRNEPFSLILLAVRDYFKFGFRRKARTLQFALRDCIEDKLPRITAPTLIIRGELDTVVPSDWAREATDLLPNGKLIEIPGGTRGINYQSPREFAEAVRKFLGC